MASTKISLACSVSSFTSSSLACASPIAVINAALFPKASKISTRMSAITLPVSLLNMKSLTSTLPPEDFPTTARTTIFLRSASKAASTSFLIAPTLVVAGMNGFGVGVAAGWSASGSGSAAGSSVGWSSSAPGSSEVPSDAAFSFSRSAKNLSMSFVPKFFPFI